MAKLGFRTVDEMVGRSDLLKRNDKVMNEHADRVDLSQILNNPFAKAGEKVTFDPKDVYDFKLGATLDEKVLLKKFGPAMDKKEKKTVKVEITNTDRTVGTILGAEITRKFGTSLEPDTYTVQCKGAGGQSFGAFIPKGLTLELEGDSNDYFGKGLSGGKLVVYPPKARKYKPEENIIVGNVALYGATSGEAYINGIAESVSVSETPVLTPLSRVSVSMERVYDRRPCRCPRRNRKELCSRHERRYRLCPG